jgi:hypothetical protein
MSPIQSLVDIAFRVDELVLQPGNMAVVRQLAETCLADPDQGNVDCLQFPTDPNDTLDWTPESIDCESGAAEPDVLTPCQTALALAALHAVHCPTAEKVVSLPIAAAEIDPEWKMTPAFQSALRWKVIRDRVRTLGAFSVNWFLVLLRRLEMTLLSLNAAKPTRSKRSTQPGQAEGLIISGLCEHHKYDDAGYGSCTELTPIRNNKFARKYHVSGSSVTNFFQKHFESRGKYISLCKNASDLTEKLKEIRGEIGARQTFGRNPPGEGRRPGQRRRMKPIHPHDRDDED